MYGRERVLYVKASSLNFITTETLRIHYGIIWEMFLDDKKKKVFEKQNLLQCN